jgi:hypothetical protein
MRRTPFDATSRQEMADVEPDRAFLRSFRSVGAPDILSKSFPGKLEWETFLPAAATSDRRYPGKPALRALKNSFTTNFIKPLTRACTHMRSAVITGASTSIGRASAKRLLDRGFGVVGSVCKQAGDRSEPGQACVALSDARECPADHLNRGILAPAAAQSS